MTKIGRFVCTEVHEELYTFSMESEKDNPFVLTQFRIDLEDKTVSSIERQEITGLDKKVEHEFLDFTFEEIQQINEFINEDKKILKWKDLNTYSTYVIKMDTHEYYLTMAHKTTLLNGNVNVYTLRFEREDTWEHINIEISDMECDQVFFNDLKLELLDTYKTEE